MGDRRVLNARHIEWDKKKIARLNYEMIFDDQAGDTKVEEDEIAALREEILEHQEKKWNLKLKRIEAEAYQKGLKEGVIQGYEKAKTEITQQISTIENAFKNAHKDWMNRQEQLDPGLLDLAFDIAEKILDLPIDNDSVREKLDRELSALLMKAEENSTIILWVHKEDFVYVKELAKEYASKISVNIQISSKCRPGEFIYETEHEKIVRNFKLMLKDFKSKLAIPSWE